MFELKNQNSRLQSINVRTEKHGPEKVLAAEIRLAIKVTNDVLSEFDPMLKSALYKKGDEAQGELIEDANYLPALKFPMMQSIGWEAELHNYDFTMHIGVSDKSNIILQDCDVDKFKFEPQHGGTVVLTFRVTIKPQAAQIGRICEFLESDIEVTLLHSEMPQKEIE